VWLAFALMAVAAAALFSLLLMIMSRGTGLRE